MLPLATKNSSAKFHHEGDPCLVSAGRWRQRRERGQKRRQRLGTYMGAYALKLCTTLLRRTCVELLEYKHSMYAREGEAAREGGDRERE